MIPINYNNSTWQERRDIRNRYVVEQNNLCIYCGEPLDGPAHSDVIKKRLRMDLFPPNFLKHPVHLHHDHDTGLTIGAVHAYCNGVLWQYDGE